MNGNLERALRKVHRFSDTRQFCGCLTPSEAMEILKAGGRGANHMYERERLQRSIDAGESNPNWFYFYPEGKMKELLGKQYEQSSNPSSKGIKQEAHDRLDRERGHNS